MKLGPQSIKNRRKIIPKCDKFFDQVFGSIFLIFEKSGSQDGGNNPIKIDKNSIQNLVFLFDRLLNKFWEGFGSQNGKNRYQNDVKNMLGSILKYK